MDKIDKDSSSSSGVTFWECNFWHLLFANDLTLLSSNKNDLQYALDRFSTVRLDTGMKISSLRLKLRLCLCQLAPCPVFFSNKWCYSPADGEI